MPVTVNEPLDGKLAIEATFSVVCVASIVWPAPFTVVPVVEVTTALSSGVPVHPLIPENFVFVLLVYVHVPVSPTAVNVPAAVNVSVDFTVSSCDVPTSWLAPSTSVEEGAPEVSWKKSLVAGSYGSVLP